MITQAVSLMFFSFIFQYIRTIHLDMSVLLQTKKAREKIRAKNYHQREDGGNMKKHSIA